jgi:cytochrome c oxidase subunit II
MWILWGGVIIPAGILIFLLGLSIYGHRSLASPPGNPVLEIEVVGHRWWWEIRYVGEGFVEANEIHIPVGQPVTIHLTSNDVIHSFWVPQLTGKMDLNPGETNSIWIQADEPGIYRGLCAEFCGLQHANMQFLVVAESQGDFETWLDRTRQPAPAPQTAEAQLGEQVFMGSSCVYCHTIRGTNALAVVGPDLTHLASRLTLAAGIIDNNPGNLAGWILDPQHIKPGNLMPPTNMTGDELQALLAYLQILE